MVQIPQGEFLMGSLDQERARFLEEVKADDDPAGIDRLRGEGPQHRVRITRPFYLGECELTQAQWLAAMGTNPSRFQDAPTRPVQMVSWDDVQGYLAKLNEGASAGALAFALPTEAQWEYACRAGTATPYCSGESAVDLRPYGWFDANSGGQTHPVGELKRNAFGLCDMHGNVFEWCADWFSGNYYFNSPEDDPQGPATGSDHVRRGGSWARSAARCRSAARSNLRSSDIHFSLVGFRVAAALPEAVLRAKLSANATRSDPKSSQFQWPADAPPLAIAPFDAAQAKAHQQAWANYLGVPVDGSAMPRRIAGDPTLVDFGPRFIANGRQIVWTQMDFRRNDDLGDVGSVNTALWVANADGSKPRRLVDGPAGGENQYRLVLGGSRAGFGDCDVVGGGGTAVGAALLLAALLLLAVRAATARSGRRPL
jgi:formylglycine-generating enzyme required for sulfatase activity